MLRFQGLWAIVFSLLVLRCLVLAGEASLVLAGEASLEYCQGDGSICEAFDGLVPLATRRRDQNITSAFAR